MFFQIPVVSPEQCDTFGKQFLVSKNELCAGAQKNKDACGGDSGGPAMMVPNIVHDTNDYDLHTFGFSISRSLPLLSKSIQSSAIL